MVELHVPFDGWTVDDLSDDDTSRLCELVDGALLVTPPPSLRHQEVGIALQHLLARSLPPAWRCVTEAGLHFDQHNYRRPDVLVYDRTASARGRIAPSDVHLAVEIVSPGSVSTDRIAKPAQYAAAGIVSFWRLELDPLVLVVHRLAGDVYEVVGRFDDEVAVDDPVELRFPLATLLD